MKSGLWVMLKQLGGSLSVSVDRDFNSCLGASPLANYQPIETSNYQTAAVKRLRQFFPSFISRKIIHDEVEAWVKIYKIVAEWKKSFQYYPVNKSSCLVFFFYFYFFKVRRTRIKLL